MDSNNDTLTPKRPDGFRAAMEYLGGAYESEIKGYIEQLEAALSATQPAQVASAAGMSLVPDHTLTPLQRTYLAQTQPAQAQQVAGELEPIAVIGSGWTFLWASGDAIEDIVKRHGLKIGTKLYTTPPTPVVPEGWRLFAIPSEWTPGPNVFKDWCTQWFGPDSDDDYLMQAAHALLSLTTTPTPPARKPLTEPDWYVVEYEECRGVYSANNVSFYKSREDAERVAKNMGGRVTAALYAGPVPGINGPEVKP